LHVKNSCFLFAMFACKRLITNDGLEVTNNRTIDNANGLGDMYLRAFDG
jgi:hypothetical protein